MRKIYLIFGKTGSGKSTLAKKLLSEFNRIIIIDTQFEYSEGIIFSNILDLQIYHFTNQPETFKYICRFDNDLDFEFLFRWIYITGDICLLAEEAEIYISPRSTQNDFLKLVRYGRHKNISIIGIARRASELSVDFRSQVTTIYSFKQTETLDLQRMQLLGFEGLENLSEFEYKEISP
jgi:hypothetical protein